MQLLQHFPDYLIQVTTTTAGMRVLVLAHGVDGKAILVPDAGMPVISTAPG